MFLSSTNSQSALFKFLDFSYANSCWEAVQLGFVYIRAFKYGKNLLNLLVDELDLR